MLHIMGTQLGGMKEPTTSRFEEKSDQDDNDIEKKTQRIEKKGGRDDNDIEKENWRSEVL